jgi:AAA15 family ATPase/GTPase
MLDSVEIKNFKRIQGNDKPLILKNLTNVNYLVGENGSGKSSMLEAVNYKTSLNQFDLRESNIVDHKEFYQEVIKS